ncbi:MAG: MATE family efflux transporter [Oscillospiraceae bacterium]
MEKVQKKTMVNDLTKGNILSILVKMAIPFMLSNLLQTFYSMADMIVVGQYVGSTGLSAVTVSSQIIMLMTTIAMGFASGGQILIAQQAGVKDSKAMRETIGTLFTTVGVISVIMTVLGLTLYAPLLRVLNLPAESWDQAVGYLTICCMGTVFTCGYNTVSSILRGMGDAKKPFIFIAIASVINVVLDLLFVAGFHMGAAGAALATIIAQGVSFVISIVYLYRHREQFGFDFKLHSFRIVKTRLLVLLKLGLPMALQHSAIMISMLFVSSFVNAFGLAASATFGIGRRVEMIPGMLTQSIMMAASAIIGQNIAAGEQRRSKQAVYYSLLFNGIIYLLAFAAFTLWPRQIFSLFTPDTEVLDLAELFISTIVVAMPAMAMMHSFNPFIQGIGNAKLSLILGICDGVIARIGLSFFLGNVLNWGLYGFFLGYCLAAYFTAIPAAVYFFSGVWKKRKLLVDTNINH